MAVETESSILKYVISMALAPLIWILKKMFSCQQIVDEIKIYLGEQYHNKEETEQILHLELQTRDQRISYLEARIIKLEKL